MTAEDQTANARADAYAALVEKIKAARPGERIVYHEGALIADRAKRPDLIGTATAAWDAHEQGTVMLAQKRLAEDRFAYLAVRTTNEVRA